MTPEEVDGLNIPFNEATLLGLAFDPETRVARLSLSALYGPSTLNVDDNIWREFVFSPVGRVAASLGIRTGDGPDPEFIPLDDRNLAWAVANRAGNEIYGWEFFDVPEERSFADWSDRLGLDWRANAGGMTHSLDIWAEDFGRGSIDVRIWFDTMTIFDIAGNAVSLDEFVASGRRWWEDFFGSGERARPERRARGDTPD